MIKDFIENNYSIGKILQVEPFSLSYNKFLHANRHFLVKTKDSIFFLKKYPLSHITKTKNEVFAITSLVEKIAIPAIVKNKESYSYTTTEYDVYVLYKYVEGDNLKDLKVEPSFFVDTFCKVQSKLIHHIEDKNLYDFNQHYHVFLKEITAIEDVVKKLQKESDTNNILYINFLKNNIDDIFRSVANLDIKINRTHGDLLPQNILKDRHNNIWIIDWERSKEYITVIDILRSITFLFFDPSNPLNMGLDVNKIGKWTAYAFEKIGLIPDLEKTHAVLLFNFHLLTHIDFLKRLYIEKQELQVQRAEEDFFICRWYLENSKKLQHIINN